MFGKLITTCLETLAAAGGFSSSLYDMLVGTGFSMSRLRYELMSKPGLKVGQGDTCLLIDSYDFHLVGLCLAGA